MSRRVTRSSLCSHRTVTTGVSARFRRLLQPGERVRGVELAADLAEIRRSLDEHPRGGGTGALSVANRHRTGPVAVGVQHSARDALVTGVASLCPRPGSLDQPYLIGSVRHADG